MEGCFSFKTWLQLISKYLHKKSSQWYLPLPPCFPGRICPSIGVLLGWMPFCLIFICVLLADFPQSTIFAFLELFGQIYIKSFRCSPGNIFIWMAQLPVIFIYISGALRFQHELFLFALVYRNWLNVHSIYPSIYSFDTPIKNYGITINMYKLCIIVWVA